MPHAALRPGRPARRGRPTLPGASGGRVMSSAKGRTFRSSAAVNRARPAGAGQPAGRAGPDRVRRRAGAASRRSPTLFCVRTVITGRAGWSVRDGRRTGAVLDRDADAADGRHRPPPARAERPARRRRHRRRGVPPPARMGIGWLLGGRPVLRALRVPHHQPPAGGVGRLRPHQPGGVLGPAGPAPAPRAVPGRRRAGALSDPQRHLRRTGRQRPRRPVRACGATPSGPCCTPTTGT